jgi:hypothetical protein
VASLQQAAIVGGLKVDELIRRLRKEVGQNEFLVELEGSEYLFASPPGWFDTTRITHRFDASPVISAGGSPMADILAFAHKLKPGELLELKTPFIPAPIKLFRKRLKNKIIFVLLSFCQLFFSTELYCQELDIEQIILRNDESSLNLWIANHDLEGFYASHNYTPLIYSIVFNKLEITKL